MWLPTNGRCRQSFRSSIAVEITGSVTTHTYYSQGLKTFYLWSGQASLTRFMSSKISHFFALVCSYLYLISDETFHLYRL